ncbi:MAG: fumarylacetoacetate hydrolase family protein [Chloroflexota bacterium]|nr:fumarylacetoacetate hydrolase family protein [Chloroflexota bacterium]
MRLASIRGDAAEYATILTPDGVIPLEQLNRLWNTDLPTSLFELIGGNHATALTARLAEQELPPALPLDRVTFAPPYRRLGKIWGIGLNYRDHARDLDEEVPAQPASFMKPATAIIGPGDAIQLPRASQRVTAEAELAVIIGQRCRNVTREEVPSVIFGYTCVLDMTAEDILRLNPRYLTRAKSFDTFFSFGPVILTRDEVPDVRALTVQTIVDGQVRARNTVSHMTFDPFELVHFHSQGMTLEPGDIISTGTPGAWPIEPGAVVRCEIAGFPILENPVAS